MRIKKYRKQEGIPVSNNQLAAYLQVTPSTMSMTSSGRHKRKLPSIPSVKLAELQRDFELMKANTGKAGKSLNKINELENSGCKKIQNKLLGEVKYFTSKVPVLERRLEFMRWQYVQNILWLKVIEARLANSPNADRIWLSNQQVKTVEKIKKNGIPEQLKIELDIEMSKARSMVYEKLQSTIEKMLH